MSVIKTTTGQPQLETRKCPNCQSVLPAKAQFCGTCGRRVSQSVNSSSPQVEKDINERYRITSLIRRRPYVQLLMATDLQYQRPVIIRDIDISSLHKQTQTIARQAIEEEYNQLRRQRIQDVMLLVDLRCLPDHIYTVAEWPFTAMRREKHERPLYTLDDLLQSGIGLPNETEAVLWIQRLAQAAANLHSQHIILSDLDPYAIIVSNDTYEGIPALMVSWLPQAVRNLFPPPPAKTYTNSFYAPETRKGDIREQSDIYSLGAILYLLLTGIAPTIKTQGKKRILPSPRELHSTVSIGIDAIVMRALSNDPVDRFNSTQEFAEALSDLITTPTQQSTHPLISSVFKGKRDSLELPAVRPTKPASPYSTRVLPAVPPGPPVLSIPPVLPQTPQPVSSPGPMAPLTNTTNQTAQPMPPVVPKNSTNISAAPTNQGKRPLDIADIETIIINASEFEAALAQASHHLLNIEDEEMYARLAGEAPEAIVADAEMHNQIEAPPEGIVETQLADNPVTAQASPSTQNEEQQNLSDNATPNITMIEEQTAMTLEEEIQTHVEIKRSEDQENSIADLPTVSFTGPDQAMLEAASKQLEEAKTLSAEEGESATQAVLLPSTKEEDEEIKPAEQATSLSTVEEIEEVEKQETPIEIEEAEKQEAPIEIEEAETQETPIEIEDIATVTFAEPVQLSIPAELDIDEPGEADTIDLSLQSGSEAEDTINRSLQSGSVEQAPAEPLSSEPLIESAEESEPQSPVQADVEHDNGNRAGEQKPLGEQIKRFFTGPIPIIPRLLQGRTASDNAPVAAQTLSSQGTANAETLLRRLRHFILGQQQHNTSAAALIETPLRIQPNQNYTIRIQIMGRDTPREKGVGLSGLIQDEYVHIEVRSALYHKYAYIVQQADIRLPGQGFAAAITIPMKPLSDGPSGRRERLHVYFMDEQRNPLYEKPFAIEIFISPLVQPGREGHNVLPIPL
jgi:serine/threonine protein kinase